jgi:hypothetical protein
MNVVCKTELNLVRGLRASLELEVPSKKFVFLYFNTKIFLNTLS